MASEGGRRPGGLSRLPDRRGGLQGTAEHQAGAAHGAVLERPRALPRERRPASGKQLRPLPGPRPAAGLAVPPVRARGRAVAQARGAPLPRDVDGEAQPGVGVARALDAVPVPRDRAAARLPQVQTREARPRPRRHAGADAGRHRVVRRSGGRVRVARRHPVRKSARVGLQQGRQLQEPGAEGVSRVGLRDGAPGRLIPGDDGGVLQHDPQARGRARLRAVRPGNEDRQRSGQLRVRPRGAVPRLPAFRAIAQRPARRRPELPDRGGERVRQRDPGHRQRIRAGSRSREPIR